MKYQTLSVNVPRPAQCNNARRRRSRKQARPNALRAHLAEKEGGDMIKIVDTFWTLYHVGGCLGMPENQILGLQVDVPTIRNFEKLLFYY